MKTEMPIALCALLVISVAEPVRAEPWTLPRGGVFASASVLGTRSRSLFDNSSDRVQFLNNGLSRVGGIALDGAYGVSDALTVSASVPVLLYSLKDDIVREEGLSLGDIRGSVRYRLFNRILVSSVEVALKLPAATEADPTRIQVGEGQYDIDLVWSLGWSRRPISASLDVGYRRRLRNPDTEFKPGDEIPFRLGGTYRLSDRFLAGLSLDGFWGRTGNANAFNLDLQVTRSVRRLISLTPAITYRLTDRIGLDLRTSFPLVGRNSYAGSLFTLGISFSNSETGFDSSTHVPSPRGGSCCAIQ